jgi:hypothetical protein
MPCVPHLRFRMVLMRSVISPEDTAERRKKQVEPLQHPAVPRLAGEAVGDLAASFH